MLCLYVRLARAKIEDLIAMIAKLVFPQGYLTAIERWQRAPLKGN